MKSPEDYIFKKGGFTIIELIIVLAILVFLIVASFPTTVNFYQTRLLDVHLNEIVQTLRRAQIKAMAADSDSSFGVHINSSFYVLFKGNSYENRDQVFDEFFSLPNNLSVTGLSEIVFNKLRGTPSRIGDINLTIDNQLKTITVNEVGMINY